MKRKVLILVFGVVLFDPLARAHMVNALSVAVDAIAYLLTGKRERQEYGFEPMPFDRYRTGVVYRMTFSPSRPRPYILEVVHPFSGGGPYGWAHTSFDSVNVRVVVRDLGSDAKVELVSTNAMVCVTDASCLRWCLVMLDPSDFPWYYGRPCEVAVELLSPMRKIPEIYGGGRLIIYQWCRFGEVADECKMG